MVYGVKMSEKIFAFIDSQNLKRSIEKDIFLKKSGRRLYTGWKLNFKKFRIYLKDKFGVSKAYLFIGKVEGNELLYKYLEDSGYEIIFKPTFEYLSEEGDKKIKGNVDAELVLHKMIEFPNFDKAIIVAGDGDYHCLIEYLQTKEKLLKILIPNKYSYSQLLKEFIENIEYVSDLESKLK